MKYSSAIEIGKNYLKIAVADLSKKKGNQLLDCIVEPIVELSAQQLSQNISVILQKNKLKLKSVSISLSRNSVTLRNLHLPSKDSKELTQMIDLHITRIVPYRKEEITFASHPLGVDEMGYSAQVIAVVHNDIINRQIRSLELSGMFIDRISLSSYDTWQWCLKNCSGEMNKPDLYMLLDIDTFFVDFIVFNQNDILFSRNISLDMSQEALTPNQITRILGEVRQSLVIFQNEENAKKPVKIFISGAILAKDLIKTLSSEFEMPVVDVPMFPAGSLVGKNKSMPKNVSVSSVVNLVLAPYDKGLIFMVPAIQIKKALREKTRDLIVLGALAVYLIMIILAFFWGRIFAKQAYLKNIHKQNQEMRLELGGLLERYKKSGLVKKIFEIRRSPWVVLFQLQQLITPEVVINSFSMDESFKISCRGEAANLADVFKFIDILEKSEYFSDVQTKSTRTRRIADKEVTDFDISLQLDLGEDIRK